MKNLIFSVFLIAIILFVVQGKQPVAKYVVKWRSCNVTSNPKYVSFAKCNIIQPEQLYVSGIIIYAVDITPGYMGRIRLDVPRPNGDMLPIFNIDVDYCKFFEKEPENNVMKILRQSFDEHSNFTQCPHGKDIVFEISNYTVDITNIPFVPESDFVVSAKYIFPNNEESIRFEMLATLELRRKRPMRVYS